MSLSSVKKPLTHLNVSPIEWPVVDDSAPSTLDATPFRLLIGKWDVVGKNMAGAGENAGTEVTGEAVYDFLPGHFFVMCKWDRHFGLGEQRGRHVGLGVISYDASNSSYQSNNYDNLGFQRRYAVVHANDTWTFTGETERGTITLWPNGAHFTEEWEVLQSAGQWVSLCMLKATRRLN